VLDNEDKAAWCEAYGTKVESQFVGERLFNLGVIGFMNPEKRINKYAHDIFVQLKGDVKTVRTPYFKAQEHHGIDPQYAVTFNSKDGKRYFDLYPDILVAFDVKWEEPNCSKEIGSKVYTVAPMHLTAVGFLTNIWQAIQAGGEQVVEYQRRIYDQSGNAKTSYVFDVRNLHVIKEVAL